MDFAGSARAAEDRTRWKGIVVPYFFGYKMEDLSFQNHPNCLDPSYKMDLDH